MVNFYALQDITMDYRSPEFYLKLVNHRIRQDKPGRCWPATQATFYRSREMGEWTQSKLARRLKITSVNHGAASEVIKMLNEHGFPTHHEGDCGKRRLYKIMTTIPKNVGIFAIIWDARVHPLYTPETDQPEDHVVSILDAVKTKDGGMQVVFYDPHSVFGGLDSLEWQQFKLWWHEGPKSRRLPDHREKPPLPWKGRQWFLVVGMGKEEFYDYVGSPDGTIRPKRTIITPEDL